MKPGELLIATNNPGKLEEMKALLGELSILLVTPSDLGLDLNVVEDGLTYAENAKKKAAAFAHATGLISMADDSGLEVDALDRAPGVYSARYLSKPGATDADRRAYLLENLRSKPRPWRARFRATVAIAIPQGGIRVCEGECPGEIIPEERGTGGFGYDRIFLVSGSGRTMAELSMDEKNRISHRARAVLKAREILSEIFEA